MKAPRRMREPLARLVGAPCWHVSAGEGIGSRFTLALGGKIKRRVPLRNPKQPRLYRDFEGEYVLFVLCTWRLVSSTKGIVSSDDEPRTIDRLMSRLRGHRVASIEVAPPFWDLRVRFARGHELFVFCDHVTDRSSAPDNWTFEYDDEILSAGPGNEWRVEKRRVEL